MEWVQKGRQMTVILNYLPPRITHFTFYQIEAHTMKVNIHERSPKRTYAIPNERQKISQPVSWQHINFEIMTSVSMRQNLDML